MDGLLGVAGMITSGYYRSFPIPDLFFTKHQKVCIAMVYHRYGNHGEARRPSNDARGRAMAPFRWILGAAAEKWCCTSTFISLSSGGYRGEIRRIE